MSSLVHLYPRAWRDRYEAEFLTLLSDRPPTLAHRADIVWGAVDAWLHPQVHRDAPSTDERTPLLIPGLAALAGGLIWILDLALAVARLGDNTSLLLIAAMLFGVGVTGTYLAPILRRLTGSALVLVVASVFVAGAAGYSPVTFVVGMSAAALFGAALLALGAIRAGLWPRIGPLLLIGATVVVPFVPLTAYSLGESQHDSLISLWFVPYGVGWLFLGAAMLLRTRRLMPRKAAPS